jgi:hypothetical protein
MNHFFLKTINFDFLGDSFVEGMNRSTKKGPLGVNCKMEISNSGYTQLKATKATSIKRSCIMAQDINSVKRWSISKTADYLTTYAEGLACDLFERKSSYTSRTIKQNEWMFMHTDTMKELLHPKKYTITTEPQPLLG